MKLVTFRAGTPHESRFLVEDGVWARWRAWEDALWRDRIGRMPAQQLLALGIEHWRGFWQYDGG